MKMKELLEIMSTLPAEADVFTAGLEGIHRVELGNLCPFKVRQTRFGVCVYIDDGISEHGSISDEWVPIDEFIGTLGSRHIQ